MKIKHIDNSFYRLTPAQAKALSIDGELPRDGYEKRADPEKLKAVELLVRGFSSENGWRWRPSWDKPENANSAWIKRTPLKWHDGAEVKQGWTWAIHLYFSPQPGLPVMA